MTLDFMPDEKGEKSYSIMVYFDVEEKAYFAYIRELETDKEWEIEIAKSPKWSVHTAYLIEDWIADRKREITQAMKKGIQEVEKILKQIKLEELEDGEYEI